MRLKKASASDSRVLWKWRNDPVTRANSNTRRIISWKEHSEWLKKVLKSNKFRLYMIVDKNKKVGMVRFDINDNSANVSINMNPKYRNMGFGKAGLVKSVELFRKKNPGLRQIAIIKKRNKASKSIFVNAGFNQTNMSNNGCLVFTKK